MIINDNNTYSFSAGEIVKLSVNPEENYRLDALYYNEVGKTERVPITSTNGIYSFPMPTANIVISANFVLINSGDTPGGDTPVVENIEGADVININLLNIESNNYTNFNSINGDNSTAVYSGYASANDGIINLNSTNPSGIVTTTSGGIVTKIRVNWNSKSDSSRKVDVYGSNTPYSSSADLYDANAKGTKIGTILNPGEDLTVNEHYRYIGLRSNSGALYLDNINVLWAEAPALYTILINYTAFSSAGADIGFTSSQYEAGETVTFTVTPAQGYRVASLYYTTESSATEYPINGESGTYSFIMPAANIAIEGSFELIPPTEYTVSLSSVQNGTISVPKYSFIEGETVTVTLTPETNYIVHSLYYTVNTTNRNIEVDNNIGSFQMPASNVTINCTFEYVEPDVQGRDVINYRMTGNTGTNYTEWSNKSTTTSNAIYAGNTATSTTNNDSLQIRSNNSSGIITTTSGGLVISIVIDWNENTSSDATIDIYGSNVPYTSTADLYSANKGVKLVTMDNTQTDLVLDEYTHYRYIGIRATSKVVYLNNIYINWTEAPALYTFNVDENIENGSISANAPFNVFEEGENVVLNVIPAQYYNVDTIYYTVQGSEPVNITLNNDVYSFVMPAANVTVNATFVYVAPENTHGQLISDPYSVEDAIEIINTLADNTPDTYDSYTTGIVTEIIEFSTQYGNATFNIATSNISGTTLEIYRAKYIDNTNFVDETQLNVGDTVIVKGQLYKYSGTDSVTGNPITELRIYGSSVEGVNNCNIVSINNVTTLPEYSINVEQLTGGLVVVNSEKLTFNPGESILLNVTPSNNYILDTIYYTKQGDNNNITISKNNEGIYGFKMPNGNVTINAIFVVDIEEQGNRELADPITIMLDSSAGYSDKQELSTIVSGDITLTPSGGTNSTLPTYYNSGTSVRFYQGNTFSIDAGEKLINRVKFTTGSSSGSSAIILSNHSAMNPDYSIWTGLTNNILFTISGSGVKRLTKIEINIAPPEITSMTVKTQLYKSSYRVGESLNLDGLTFTVNYSDSSSDTIDADSLTNDAPSEFTSNDINNAFIITFTHPDNNLITAQVTVSVVEYDPNQPTYNYIKVTSETNDWSGDYLIVNETKNTVFNGNLETLDAAMNFINVTISNDTIESSADIDNAIVTIEPMTDGYSIKTIRNVYISSTGGGNSLKSNDTPVLNTISLNQDNNAIITSISGTNNTALTIQYLDSSNSSRFRYYKSAQKPVALYKKTLVE